jgi:hypothetical protein
MNLTTPGRGGSGGPLVTENSHNMNTVDRCEAVLVLYSYAMDEATMKVVRRYVADGGTVWAAGPVAWKNDNGGGASGFPRRLL